MKYEINDENINLVLLYSKISMALVACRLMKTLVGNLGRPMNETEQYIIRFSATSMIIGAASIFDKNSSAINLRKTVELRAAEHEQSPLLKQVDRLYNAHIDTINHVNDYRNNLIAHTNKGMDSIEKFLKGPAGDIAKIQRLLNETLDILESMETHPKYLKRETLDYTKIREDLKE